MLPQRPLTDILPAAGHNPCLPLAMTPKHSSDLTKAVKAKLPLSLQPQIATLASKAPTGTGWIVETKLDGYRMLARVEDGKAQLITRGGHDWTDKMQSLGKAVEDLEIKNAWFDGEIVVIGGKGLPDFNDLQNAIGNKRAAERIVYFVFDAPYYGGFDMRKVPLWSRRAVLQDMLEGQDDHRIRFAQSFGASPAEMLEAARQAGLEGVMLKRMDSPYVPAAQTPGSSSSARCARNSSSAASLIVAGPSVKPVAYY